MLLCVCQIAKYVTFYYQFLLFIPIYSNFEGEGLQIHQFTYLNISLLIDEGDNCIQQLLRGHIANAECAPGLTCDVSTHLCVKRN